MLAFSSRRDEPSKPRPFSPPRPGPCAGRRPHVERRPPPDIRRSRDPKPSNNQGVWNEQGASLGLVVLRPWWQTWDFRITALAVLLSLGGAGYRWRTASIARQSHRLGRILDSAPDARSPRRKRRDPGIPVPHAPAP